MIDVIDKTLTELGEGGISRREAVARLGVLMLALSGTGKIGLAAEEQSESTFEATGLNHLALRVTDVARSRQFYEKHLGMRVLQDSGSYSCFMSCGPENFVAFFRGDEAGLDHYCYTIEDYRPGEVMETLKAAGLDPHRQSNRVYFDDPDGLTVQLSGRRSSWPG